MSLAQHVTQAEGIDYERRLVTESNPNHPVSTSEGEGLFINVNQPGETNACTEPPQLQPMSFAPVEQKRQEKPIAAYEVSPTQRWAQVITSVVLCWLTSGIVFGFAAIKPILISEGVYSELCRIDKPTANVAKDIEDLTPCTRQDLRLNLFFTIASITANVGSLITGTVLDRAGRRVCWIASSICLTLGSLLMASASRIPHIDGYIVGNIFLALGGTFIFVSSFELANTFPKHQGLIIALVTGAFDASAAVFLIYRVIYEATGYSLERFFLTYIAIPVLILLAEYSYMPAGPYHTTSQLEKMIERAQDETRDVHESDDDIFEPRELTRVRSARADQRAADLDMIEQVAGDADDREERANMDENTRDKSGVWGVLHGLEAHQQMRSPWFILILVLTSIQMLRMNYFIATIGAQYRYMLGSGEDADDINRFFNVALPVGGLIATPFIGLSLNNLSVPKTFGILTLFITTIGVLNCFPFIWAGYATVITFAIFRPFYYSAISDYTTKVFGFATFGRIYGTLICASGVTNFSQIGLDVLTHGPLNRNPTPVNIAFAVVGTIVGLSLVVFVAVRGRAFIAEEKLALEAAGERQALLYAQEPTYGIA